MHTAKMVWISFTCLLFVSFHLSEALRFSANGFPNEERVYFRVAHQEEPDLSPWELHVVNDLLVEIMLMKCKNVNPTAARGMKSFITTKVSKATKRSVMHPDFLSVYSNMVHCMNYIENNINKAAAIEKADSPQTETGVETERSDKLADAAAAVDETEKGSSSVIPVDEDTNKEPEYHRAPKYHLVEDGFKGKGKAVILDISPKKYNAKKKSQKFAKTAGVQKSVLVEKMHSQDQKKSSNNVPTETDYNSGVQEDIATMLDQATDFLSTILDSTMILSGGVVERSKRSISNEKSPRFKLHNMQPKNNMQESVLYYNRKQLLNNLKQSLEKSYRIMSGSCPSKLVANPKFIHKAILEMIHWVDMDLSDTNSSATAKYFWSRYTALQVQQCLANEASMHSQNSEAVPMPKASADETYRK